MESSARQSGVHGLTASAILEVAEGLRWTDPQLSVALAEHVARTAGADVGARSAAERSAVLALGQSDRAAPLILRAVPQLQDAERDGRSTDAGLLRCELARAAVQCDDVDAAEAALEPLAGGQALPSAVRVDALVAWSAARAARGDVPGVDAAARQVEELVGDASDDVRLLAVHRSRARARRVAGDASGALAVLRGATTDSAGAETRRETALLVADQVELLAELGRGDEARELAAPSLAVTPQATTSLAVGRMRCVLARSVCLPAGDVDTAARWAREAEVDLLDHGHEAQAAEAIEVLAEVAARRGESRHALDELRRAHAHALAARDETTDARIALAVALATPQHRPARSSDDAGAPVADVARTPLVEGALRAEEPVGSGSLGLDSDGGPRSAEDGDTAPTRPTAQEQTAPGVSPRRRGRYRDDTDPGEALAAALAAARGGSLDPFTTPPGGTPVPDDDRPGDARDGSGAGDVAAAAEARSRRLARARARWEVPESILLRRPEPAGADGHEDAPDAPLRDGDAGRAGVTSVDAAAPRDGEPEDGRSVAVASGPAPDGSGLDGGTVGDAGSSGRRRASAADSDAPAPTRRRGGHRAPDDEDGRDAREGRRHGSVGAGRVVRAEEDGRRELDADRGLGGVGAAANLSLNGWGADSPGESGHAGDADHSAEAYRSWGAEPAREAGRLPATGNGTALTETADRGSGRSSRHHEEVPARGAGPGSDDRVDRDHLADLGAAPERSDGLGHGRRSDRSDGGDQADRGRPGPTHEPLTMAAHRDGQRNGRAEPGAPVAWGLSRPEDDEYAQELALTLVDLLSEYQPAGIPLGAAGAAESAPAPTTQVEARPDDAVGEPEPPLRVNGRPGPRSRNGVSTARRADDSGPRLADLLADAMDAYHSADQAPAAPADDRRARR